MPPTLERQAAFTSRTRAAAATDRARQQAQQKRRARTGESLQGAMKDELARMSRWKALRDQWEALERGDPWYAASERVRRQNAIVKKMADLHPEFTKLWWPTRLRQQSIFDPAPSGRGERLALRLPPRRT